MALGLSGGVGMIGAGILGGPGIGYKQDYFAVEKLQQTTDGKATYACINKGGNHPSATNKETVAGPVSASGTFSSGKNGSIIGSLTLLPPGPGAFSCPPGQKLVLGQVAYCNLDLADTTTPLDAEVAPTSVSACLSTVPGVCESSFPCP